MEDDRFQKHHVLYVVGLLSLLLGLGSLAFGLFLLPYLWFGYQYDTPEFIMFWQEWMRVEWGYTSADAAKVILFTFFGSAVLCGLVAYVSSSRIDKDIFKDKEPFSETDSSFLKPSTRESMGLGLKILLIMVLVFGLAAGFEWLIASSPPPAEIFVQ